MPSSLVGQSLVWAPATVGAWSAGYVRRKGVGGSIRSAVLVGPAGSLFPAVRNVLVRRGAQEADGNLAVTVGDECALAYKYPGADWQVPRIPGYDLSGYAAARVECRSERLVADLLSVLDRLRVLGQIGRAHV